MTKENKTAIRERKALISGLLIGTLLSVLWIPEVTHAIHMFFFSLM